MIKEKLTRKIKDWLGVVSPSHFWLDYGNPKLTKRIKTKVSKSC